MKTIDFMTRVNKIRDHHDGGEIYAKMVETSITEAIAWMNDVDEQLLDLEIAAFKEHLKNGNN